MTQAPIMIHTTISKGLRNSMILESNVRSPQRYVPFRTGTLKALVNATRAILQQKIELIQAVEADGHPFLLLLMIQQPQWMPMANNFVVSLNRLGIHNVTISSTNNDVLEVAQTLGLSVFNATAVVHQMPSWFQPLPSWTWGVDMWQRYVTSFHAVRQGIGTCHFDVDTAIQSDVFFAPTGAGTGPFDITIQGHPKEARKQPLGTKESVKQCNARNVYDIRGSTGYCKFFVKQGYACYAANERTFKFFEAWNEVNRRAVKGKWFGWIQPAFNNALCHGGLSVANCTETECRATVDKYGNLSMAIFRAGGMDQDTVMKNPRKALAVHPKSCHKFEGKQNMGNNTARALCKTEFLKASGFWYVPFDLPLDVNGWKEPGLVDNVRDLLHQLNA